MNVIEIQPTPNPNAIKIIVEGQLTDRPLSFFNPQAGQDHPLASKIFEISGVTSLLILNDFVTVNKSPSAAWKQITSQAKRILTDWQG